jgi:YhcH/YjgK/YiaL family protein
MVIGDLADWKKKRDLKGLEAAFEFLEKTDLAALPLGRTDIDKDNVYAAVSQGETKPPEAAKFEAHRRYIDVQYIVSGQEGIGFAPVVALETTEAYDAAKDIEFFAMPAKFATIQMKPGRFGVFGPGEGHMPGCHLEGPHTVRKVVVKVDVEYRKKLAATA